MTDKNELRLSLTEKKDVKKSAEEVAAEEKLRAEEAAADAASGDPGTPGPPPPGWKPGQTSGQAELARQANQHTTEVRQHSPEIVDQARRGAGITNYAEPDAPPQVVGVTPGGWVPERRTEEASFQGPQFSPYIGALHGAAARTEQDANAKLAWMQAGEQAGAQGIEARRQEQERRFAEGAAKREDFKQKMIGLHRQKIEAMSKDIENSTVDRRRLFKNMGAGQVALLGVGGILASLGAGFSAAAGQNGPSPFIEQLRINSQNDIRIQEEEIRKKEGQQTKAINALDALQQTFGDRETAILALEALQLKAYERELQQLHGKYQNTALGPKLQLAQAQVAKGFADTMMKMEAQQQYQKGEKASDVFAPPKAIYAGGGPRKPPKSNAALEGQIDKITSARKDAKIDEKLSIMNDFMAAIPERQRSTAANYLRTGNIGAVRQMVLDKFAGDTAALARWEEGIDKVIRTRTGAVVKPEEQANYEQRYGLKGNSARVFGLLDSFQSDVNRHGREMRRAYPDAWFELERRDKFFGDAPTGIDQSYPVGSRPVNPE